MINHNLLVCWCVCQSCFLPDQIWENVEADVQNRHYQCLNNMLGVNRHWLQSQWLRWQRLNASSPVATGWAPWVGAERFYRNVTFCNYDHEWISLSMRDYPTVTATFASATMDSLLISRSLKWMASLPRFTWRWRSGIFLVVKFYKLSCFSVGNSPHLKPTHHPISFILLLTCCSRTISWIVVSTARCSSVPSCLRYIPSHPSHPSIQYTCSFLVVQDWPRLT